MRVGVSQENPSYYSVTIFLDQSGSIWTKMDLNGSKSLELYYIAVKMILLIQSNPVILATFSEDCSSESRASMRTLSTASRLLKTLFGNHFSRISSQRCSTGFSSGL